MNSGWSDEELNRRWAKAHMKAHFKKEGSVYLELVIAFLLISYIAGKILGAW